MTQIVLFSLAISGLYALVAIGFTLIFGVAEVLNLAHGALLMVGAYSAFVVNYQLGWNSALSAVFAVAFSAFIAVALYGGLRRYARPLFALAAGQTGFYLGHTLLRLSIAPSWGLFALAGSLYALLAYRYRKVFCPYALWVLLGALLWGLLGPLLGLPLEVALPLALFLAGLFALGQARGLLKEEHALFLIALPYVTYVGKGLFGLPIGLALGLGVAFAVLFTTGLVRYIQRSSVITMIVTLAFALILEQLILIIFGTSARILLPLVPGSVRLAGVTLTNNQILGFALSWAVIIALWLFIRYARLGKAIIATAQDRVGAALVGIDPERVYTLTWAISGGLAGLAGIFFASSLAMLPTMWRDPLIIAFAIVILGGLGSIQGSLVAAYLVGFIETLTVYVFKAEWRGLPSLILLILILMIRPRGLFGREAR